MIPSISKAEGSLLLGNVGYQPIFRQRGFPFQKNAVLSQSASKCISTFICKNTPYMIDRELVFGVHRMKDLRLMLSMDKCSKYSPLLLGTREFGETSAWQTSAKMFTGVTEGSHLGSFLKPKNAAGFV
jgi:hypothetical protein